MNKMVTRSLLALLILIEPVTGMAQNLTPYRSMAFAQVAAGVGIETRINLTNRGTNSYNGTLYLFTGTNQPWSPTVNGKPITNGTYQAPIPPGGTITIDITSPGDVTSGFALVTPSDNSASALVEGTLTYYFNSGTTVTDSVGVQPSSELYATTIPFDNFNNIALGLANLNSFDTMVHMKLYSDTNQQMGTLDLPLKSMQQVPKYLFQFFPSVTNMTRGRLDIQGDNYFIGVALTQVAGGQFSSLPLLPAAKTYTYLRTGGGQPDITGELYVFTEGNSYQFYVRDLTSGGTPVNNPLSYAQGHMTVDGLTLYNTGRSQGQEYILYIIANPFGFSMQTVTGVWYGILTSSGPLGNAGVLAQGAMTMTATN